MFVNRKKSEGSKGNTVSYGAKLNISCYIWSSEDKGLKLLITG